MWLIASGPSDDQLLRCCEKCYLDWPEEVKESWIAIYIAEGWTMIQHASTLHAPTTVDDGFMTGTMH